MSLNLSLLNGSSLLILKFIIIPSLVFLATFLILYPIQNIVAIPNDEGFLLHPAQRIFNGEIPYLDFRRTYPPGRAYLLSCFFKIFGMSWYTAKMWFLFSFCTQMALLFICTLLLTDSLLISLMSCGVAVCYLFPHSRFYSPVFVHSTMNADRLCTSLLGIIFFSLYCITKLYLFLIVAGFFMGITFALGQEIALCINAASFIAICVKGDNILNEFSCLMAGVCAAILLCYTAIKKIGMTLAKLWEYDFKDIFTYIKQTRLPYPRFFSSPGGAPSIWRSFFSSSAIIEKMYTQRFFLPWLLYLSLALFYLYKKVNGVITDTDMMTIQILLFGIFFLAYLVQRADYEHLAVSLTPFYVLYSYGAYKVFTTFWNHYSLGKLDFIFFGAAYLSTLFLITGLYDGITCFFSYKKEKELKGTFTLLKGERGGVYFRSAVITPLIPVVGWIETHIPKDDYLFIVPSLPHLYFLTGRRNPTKIISILPQIHPDDVVEMVNDLEERRPQYTVYNKELVESSYQNGMHLRQYASLLYTYIWEKYEVEIALGSYLILQRKSG